MYALSRLVYTDIRGETPGVDGITAMLEGVKPASGENINREDAIQSQIARIFYKADNKSSGRSSFLCNRVSPDIRRRD
jgi:hypothetical protein